VERSFYRWYSTGCRYISLVASGSFYILVLAAGLELRKTIAEVGGHIFSEVGQMLRRPETSCECNTCFCFMFQLENNLHSNANIDNRFHNPHHRLDSVQNAHVIGKAILPFFY
jgi:hypothetical protein